jgi:hypothetical protein
MFNTIFGSSKEERDSIKNSKEMLISHAGRKWLVRKEKDQTPIELVECTARLFSSSIDADDLNDYRIIMNSGLDKFIRKLDKEKQWPSFLTVVASKLFPNNNESGINENEKPLDFSKLAQIEKELLVAYFNFVSEKDKKL